MLISQENNVTLFCFMLLILFIFFTFHFRMKCNLKIFSREWERKKKEKTQMPTESSRFFEHQQHLAEESRTCFCTTRTSTGLC